MIFITSDYDNRKMLEVRFLEEGRAMCAYLLYNEGEYEEAKKELTEFITKRA